MVNRCIHADPKQNARKIPAARPMDSLGERDLKYKAITANNITSTIYAHIHQPGKIAGIF